MPKQEIEKLISFLLKLTARNFFGKVVIVFQNGRMEKVVTETVMKFDEMEDPEGLYCGHSDKNMSR